MEKSLKNKIQEIRVFYKVIFYILLGALWSLSNVGYSFGLLTWFTFVPFIFFIKYEKFNSGFLFAWIFGTSAYLFHFWWLVNPFVGYFSLSSLVTMKMLGWVVGGFLTLLICVYHGLMYGLIYIIAKYISTKKNGNIFYLVMPIVVTSLDYFYPKLFYDQIGYSQYIFLNFSQIADTLGVPIITFIIIACNTCIIMMIEAFLFKRNMVLSVGLFTIELLLIVGVSLYGDFRRKEIVKLINEAPKVKIGIVQGNFSGIDKRNLVKRDDMKATYNRMSEELLKLKPDLIVWPESAIPEGFDIDQLDFSDTITYKNTPTLFSAYLVKQNETSGIDYYVSFILLDKNREKVGHYFKSKLMPFIEEVPIPKFNYIMPSYGFNAFTRGTEYKILELDEMKMALNICYEDIIPTFIRESIQIGDQKANIIINGTNDSWFGNSIEPKMHLHIAGFRSIENRKSLVRSTCTGYSGFVKPDGTIVDQSELFKPYSKVEELPLMQIDTLFNKGGWTFIYFLASSIVFIFGYALFRKIYFYNKKSKIIAEKHHKKMLYKMWLD